MIETLDDSLSGLSALNSGFEFETNFLFFLFFMFSLHFFNSSLLKASRHFEIQEAQTYKWTYKSSRPNLVFLNNKERLKFLLIVKLLWNYNYDSVINLTLNSWKFQQTKISWKSVFFPIILILHFVHQYYIIVFFM